MLLKRFRYGNTIDLVISFLFLIVTSCGVQQLPPLKYVPKLGQDGSISTVDVLAQALNDEDVLVRAKAIQLLGSLYQDSTQQEKIHNSRILGKASQDPDPAIRLQAIEILGTFEAQYSNQYLQKALNDSNLIVRERVMKVLGDRHKKK